MWVEEKNRERKGQKRVGIEKEKRGKRKERKKRKEKKKKGIKGEKRMDRKKKEIEKRKETSEIGRMDHPFLISVRMVFFVLSFSSE